MKRIELICLLVVMIVLGTWLGFLSRTVASNSKRLEQIASIQADLNKLKTRVDAVVNASLEAQAEEYTRSIDTLTAKANKTFTDNIDLLVPYSMRSKYMPKFQELDARYNSGQITEAEFMDFRNGILEEMLNDQRGVSAD